MSLNLQLRLLRTEIEKSQYVRLQPLLKTDLETFIQFLQDLENDDGLEGGS